MNLISHINKDIYGKKTREIGVQCELGCEIIGKIQIQNNNNNVMNISGENLYNSMNLLKMKTLPTMNRIIVLLIITLVLSFIGAA